MRYRSCGEGSSRGVSGWERCFHPPPLSIYPLTRWRLYTRRFASPTPRMCVHRYTARSEHARTSKIKLLSSSDWRVVRILGWVVWGALLVWLFRERRAVLCAPGEFRHVCRGGSYQRARSRFDDRDDLVYGFNRA